MADGSASVAGPSPGQHQLSTTSIATDSHHRRVHTRHPISHRPTSPVLRAAVRSALRALSLIARAHRHSLNRQYDHAETKSRRPKHHYTTRPEAAYRVKGRKGQAKEELWYATSGVDGAPQHCLLRQTDLLHYATRRVDYLHKPAHHFEKLHIPSD